MRWALLSPLGLCLCGASANIIFNRVQPKCDFHATDYSGCLSGQVCTEKNSCVPVSSAELKTLQFRRESPKWPPSATSGDRCGPAHGNRLCGPSGNSSMAMCCSQYGWCGTTPAHCDVGCLSGCNRSTPAVENGPIEETASQKFRSDGRCGKDFNNAECDPNGPYGGCCSSYGYCGKSAMECLKANDCQSGCREVEKSLTFGSKFFDSWAFSGISAATREDGRCGRGFEGTTCDPRGPFGPCCSQYGYCGRTPDHCFARNGCQSGCADGLFSSARAIHSSLIGDLISASSTRSSSSTATVSTTTGEPVLAMPSLVAPVGPSGTPTTDGSCGATAENTVCDGWPLGNCCSLYGYCGNTTAHCGEGCQSGPCLAGQPPAVAPGPMPAPLNDNPGTLSIVSDSGVPAMHAGLLPNGRVIFLDKVEDYTRLRLPNGKYAYAAEYDPNTRQAVPLGLRTNAFCSGGSFLADGAFVAVGGNAPLADIDPTVGDGFTGIRFLRRSFVDQSLNGRDWVEPGNRLSSARWYPTVQTLANGSLFVASGSLNGLDPAKTDNNNPTYEMLSAQGVSAGRSVPMNILTKNQPYYMYPFIHLLRDGTLYILVAKSSELFNTGTGMTVRHLPDMPGDYRTYPNTGASVLLPLTSANNWDPEILVCGGGAYQDITSPTEPSCGRIRPLAATPSWEMDSMPEGRGMVEGTLLPDGTIALVNGCNRGAQGFALAASPTLQILLYDPSAAFGRRFTLGPRSTIPRLYHSVALLLLDGTLLIAGSNPVEQPQLVPSAANPYVTDFRVESYTPPYLSGANAGRRPANVRISQLGLRADGSRFTVAFDAPGGARGVRVALYHGGFVTHSVHMGHRMAFLDVDGFVPGREAQEVGVRMPPDNNVVPPGPYVVYVVVDGVPAVGQFVMVS